MPRLDLHRGQYLGGSHPIGKAGDCDVNFWVACLGISSILRCGSGGGGIYRVPDILLGNSCKLTCVELASPSLPVLWDV